MKTTLSRLLCIVLTISFLSACQGGNPSGSQSSSHADQVVARVGDTDILYSQLAEQMAMLDAMYSDLSDQFTTEELQEKLHTAALSSLENLITQQILNSKIEEYGLTLTPEEQEQAQHAWDQTLESITSSVQSSYPDLTGDDLDSMVQAALEASGQEEQTVVDRASQSILVGKLKEQALSQTVPLPDRARVEAAYTKLLAQQQEQFDQDVTSFESAMILGDPVAYVPRSYRVIQEIQLLFDNDVIQLLRQMKQYDSDDSDSYEEMLSLEFQRLLEGNLPQLYDQLDQGTPFSQLMEEIKPGSSDTYNYISEDTTRLSQEYQQAALSIPAPGQISGTPVKLEYGYAVLCWADSLDAGARPLEEVYHDLEQQLLEADRNRAWSDLQAQWRQEAQVEIFEDRLGY